MLHVLLERCTYEEGTRKFRVVLLIRAAGDVSSMPHYSSENRHARRSCAIKTVGKSTPFPVATRPRQAWWCRRASPATLAVSSTSVKAWCWMTQCGCSAPRTDGRGYYRRWTSLYFPWTSERPHFCLNGSFCVQSCLGTGCKQLFEDIIVFLVKINSFKCTLLPPTLQCTLEGLSRLLKLHVSSPHLKQEP